MKDVEHESQAAFVVAYPWRQRPAMARHVIGRANGRSGAFMLRDLSTDVLLALPLKHHYHFRHSYKYVRHSSQSQNALLDNSTMTMPTSRSLPVHCKLLIFLCRLKQ